MSKYGIINEYGNFMEIPKKITHNGRTYYNPRGEMCKQFGYYELIETDCPIDEKEYYLTYEMNENEQIVQVWVEVEVQEELIEEPQDTIIDTPTLSYKDVVISKVRMVYSIDDEIAILRQKDTKPEEFEAYYNFVEQCKAEAKEELGL
jgi:hypothetical protein